MKSDLRKKMSVIATNTIDNDEELQMSGKMWDKVRRKGFEHIHDKTSSDESEEDSDEDSNDSDLLESGEEEQEESDSDIDLHGEKDARVNAMADEFEQQIK